jgi:histone acetyltransferase (RNA polymerase elongator complex component)
MHATKALLSSLFVVALVAAPLSSASAAWRHRGLVPGLFGAAEAVVVGAATIATAPLAILAGVGPRGYYRGPRGYAYYGPPRGYYAPPPVRHYAPRRYYGPPPGYDSPRPRYYGPPPGY